MRYNESLRYLNSFLNLERIIYQPQNRFYNLERMRFLLKWFGHPEKNFFPILIAGTKGKGSTGFFLESILVRAGINTGFYSSPHLEDARERIRIGGRMISEAKWAAGVAKVGRVLKRHRLNPKFGDFTYFEVLTLLSMLIFKEAGVRIGIFEIGMGGRLDATNILTPKISILTPIHLDHEEFLGPTIAKIAHEKAAIIRRASDVVVARQTPEAMREIHRNIKKKKANLWASIHVNGARIGLRGDFQKENAGAALRAAKLLSDKYGFAISERAIAQGLASGNWPGRLELFPGQPDILLDGAHNPAATRALVKALRQDFHHKKPILIFAVSRDKKSDIMLETLGSFFPRCILTRTPNPRSQEIGTLMAQAQGHFKEIFPAGSIGEALVLAKKMAGPKTLAVITGSFYLIGEARKIIQKVKGKRQK